MASAVVSSTLNMAQAWAAELRPASANRVGQRQAPAREFQTLPGPFAHLGRVTGMEIPGASAETGI
jgi:hypothetical protein